MYSCDRNCNCSEPTKFWQDQITIVANNYIKTPIHLEEAHTTSFLSSSRHILKTNQHFPRPNSKFFFNDCQNREIQTKYYKDTTDASFGK